MQYVITHLHLLDVEVEVLGRAVELRVLPRSDLASYASAGASL